MKKNTIIFLALVRYGGGLADILGSIGGTTFSRNKSGAVARNRTTPTNPQTPVQTANRNRFGVLSMAWRSLTQSMRNSWDAVVDDYPYTNRLGEVRTYSGQQLYNKLNGNLTSIGEAAIDEPLAPISLPSLVITGIAASIASNKIILDGTMDNGTDVPNGFAVRVYATSPVSGGKNASSTPSKLIGVLDEGDAFDAAELQTDYESVYGASWKSIGQKIIFKFDVVSKDTGQAGNKVTFRSTVVA